MKAEDYLHTLGNFSYEEVEQVLEDMGFDEEDRLKKIMYMSP